MNDADGDEQSRSQDVPSTAHGSIYHGVLQVYGKLEIGHVKSALVRIAATPGADCAADVLLAAAEARNIGAMPNSARSTVNLTREALVRTDDHRGAQRRPAHLLHQEQPAARGDHE